MDLLYRGSRGLSQHKPREPFLVTDALGRDIYLGLVWLCCYEPKARYKKECMLRTVNGRTHPISARCRVLVSSSDSRPSVNRLLDSYKEFRAVAGGITRNDEYNFIYVRQQQDGTTTMKVHLHFQSFALETSPEMVT
ncbi:hypothetical protein BGZ47_011240 [Haplosporangium gracile]|nr:hypothetical protein BGZ47_011240 [Haplosporangium gracile]